MRGWIAALAGALLAAGARADCAMPVDYRVVEDPPGTATICLQVFPARTCPDEGLVRVRPDTGEAVVVTTCDGQACFVDECVPAGQYQYGLAQPFLCDPTACFTAYWEPLAAAGAPSGCVRAGPAPTPATSVPWATAGQYVCRYHGGGFGWGEGLGCGCGRGGPVLWTNAALLLAGLALWRRGRGRLRP